MKDGYFDPEDVKSIRRCMKKFDEYVVARATGLAGHELPPAKAGLHPEGRLGHDPVFGHRKTCYCLLSCIELADAEHYINSNDLQDDPAITVLRVADATIDKVHL
jgi:hypothetical protein